VGFARIAGTDRYLTAVAISEAAFPNGAPGVVITTGLNYPDALAGASLAYLTGPVLLVGAKMSQAVKDEITRLKPERAVILGSTKVVSATIESYLKGKGITVQRFGGADRYATAALIARETAKIWGSEFWKTAIIATGENFPDALAASPMSAVMGMPILLVKRNAVPAATKAMLTELGITETFLCGGTSVINAAVEGQLPSPYRRGGANRYQTTAMIADHMWMNWGMGVEYFALATGENFPDALVGGAFTGAYGGVLYLTPPDALHSEVVIRIERDHDRLKWVDVFGGKSVVYPTVVEDAFNLLY
jgi:putative cell wall-binding protein